MTIGFAHDNSRLIVAGDFVRIYDVKSGDLVHEVSPLPLTRVVAVSPTDQTVFATGSDDGVVRLWRISKEAPIRELNGHTGMLQGLAFSPDGRLLISVSQAIGPAANGEVRLWKSGTGELIRKLNFQDAGISAVAFSADGRLVAFSTNARDPDVASTIEVYEVATWNGIRSVKFSPGFATSLAFFPDSKRLLITGGVCVPLGERRCLPTGVMWLVDADAMEARELEDSVPGHHGYFRGAAVIGNGDRFFTSTTAPRESPPMIGDPGIVADFEMRETETGKLIWSRQSDGISGTTAAIVSSDGKLVAGCDNDMILVFDSSTGNLVLGVDVNDE
jgi:WD40 repeat protein